MQLRDHPVFIIKYFGSSWPLVWVSCDHGHGKTLFGERGLLVETKIEARLPTRLFMWIEHNNERYAGALVVNDAVLSCQLNNLSSATLGQTIKEIGDLEVDFLL